MISQNDEWLKKKRWEQKVKEWISKFSKTEGNKEEWLKIYQAYRQSDVWEEKRKAALRRAGYRCESCGSLSVAISYLDVHHLTYDRVGGNEKETDLEVLCYPCHQKADRKRDVQTAERRRSNYYQTRFDGFASKKYGDSWAYDHDEQEVEIEFITFLYKKHCEEMGFDFDPHFDPETDFDFLEFWDKVLDGND
jgi:5-methylcytosine-specific restriction endonuclease McrA